MKSAVEKLFNIWLEKEYISPNEWSIEHGESFFAYIEDQIIKQLKGKQQEQ